jgi:hypothetical protein
MDRECAERVILNGIEDRLWPQIDQLVSEVHDQGIGKPTRMRDQSGLWN